MKYFRYIFIFLVFISAVFLLFNINNLLVSSNKTEKPFEKTPIVHKEKIAILYISTGRYIVFWNQFYQATEKYFLPGYHKTYFLFTDHKKLKLPENVISVYTPQEPWPYITLKRYHFFLTQEDNLKDFDYIFFMNGNLIFQKPIHEEVIPSEESGIMVTIHPGFPKETRPEFFTYDRNPKSKAYVSEDEGEYYFMGGFNGGTSKAFLKMSKTIKDWTDTDLENNIIPLWHDESMLNRYMIDYMKTKKPLILNSEYAVPEEYLRNYKGDIKGILLDKNKKGVHSWMRQQN